MHKVKIAYYFSCGHRSIEVQTTSHCVPRVGDGVHPPEDIFHSWPKELSSDLVEGVVEEVSWQPFGDSVCDVWVCVVPKA